MDLTIVVPIYKESNYLKVFLEKLAREKTTNFEVIFVIDTMSENCFEIIDNNDIKGSVKIVFNSKRRGRDEAIKSGISEAKGDRTIIVSSSNSFHEGFIKEIKQLITKNDYDIIEFNARFRKPIHMLGTPRKNIKTNEAKNVRKEIIAYSYPLEFNKIFKTKLLKKIIKLSPISSSHINSRFSVELILQSLRMCESYISISKKIIRSRKSTNTPFNPLKVQREWDNIIASPDFKDLKSSLLYNLYFNYRVVYLPIAYLYKNKMLVQKLSKIVDQYFNKDFFQSNEFYLLQNKETDILKENQNKVNNKLYREF